MLELYLWGVLASAAMTALVTYFEEQDITLEELLYCALMVVLSWAGVVIFAAYFIFEAGPKWFKANVDLKKVVYKRKK